MNYFLERERQSIRLADQRDIPLFAPMIASLLQELGPEDAEAVSVEALEQTTRDLMGGDRCIWVLLAEDENESVDGVIVLNECAAIYAGGRFGEITELYVQPHARSTGVGSTLIFAARKLAREKGWKRLEVGAPDMPKWQRSFDFYSREGFELVGPRLRSVMEQE